MDMNTTTDILIRKKILPASLLNVLGIGVIYFTPALSHLAGIPFYLFEPMRIFVILSLLHSGRINSYALAIGLPLFSFFISSHPVLVKALLIAFELVVNVAAYYGLKKRLTTPWAIVVSVILAKGLYYSIKYLLIQTAVLDSGLISTPIYIQVLTTTVFGIYAFLWTKKK